MRIQNAITKQCNKIKRIKCRIKKLISGLLDNPKIKRLSESSFTINFKDLSPDYKLSAEYYDFKHQYKTLVKIIEECRFENILAILDEIVKKGRFYIGYVYHFHPEVIRNLKRML